MDAIRIIGFRPSLCNNGGLVLPVTKVPEKGCSLCKNIHKQRFALGKCGHMFCEVCLKTLDAMDYNGLTLYICGPCKDSTKRLHPPEEILLRDEDITDILIYCPNRRTGKQCKKIITVGNLERHKQEVCESSVAQYPPNPYMNNRGNNIPQMLPYYAQGVPRYLQRMPPNISRSTGELTMASTIFKNGHHMGSTEAIDGSMESPWPNATPADTVKWIDIKVEKALKELRGIRQEVMYELKEIKTLLAAEKERLDIEE